MCKEKNFDRAEVINSAIHAQFGLELVLMDLLDDVLSSDRYLDHKVNAVADASAIHRKAISKVAEQMIDDHRAGQHKPTRPGCMICRWLRP